MEVCPTSPLTHPHTCTGPTKLSNFPLAQEPCSACHLLCWQDPPEEHQQQGRNWNVTLWIFIHSIFTVTAGLHHLSDWPCLPGLPCSRLGEQAGVRYWNQSLQLTKPQNPHSKPVPIPAGGKDVSHSHWPLLHRLLRTFALGREL